jgi:hypothetical protein
VNLFDAGLLHSAATRATTRRPSSGASASQSEDFLRELGHNLWLYHSHALACEGAVMAGSCTSVDYGDQFGVIGSVNGPTHFKAVQEELLGWLDYGASPPISEVTASGTYTIDPYESVGTAPKARRIKTATGGGFSHRATTFSASVQWRHRRGPGAGPRHSPRHMSSSPYRA